MRPRSEPFEAEINRIVAERRAAEEAAAQASSAEPEPAQEPTPASSPPRTRGGRAKAPKRKAAPARRADSYREPPAMVTEERVFSAGDVGKLAQAAHDRGPVTYRWWLDKIHPQPGETIAEVLRRAERLCTERVAWRVCEDAGLLPLGSRP